MEYTLVIAFLIMDILIITAFYYLWKNQSNRLKEAESKENELLEIRSVLLERIKWNEEDISEKDQVLSECRKSIKELVAESKLLKEELLRLEEKKMEEIPLDKLDDLIVMKKVELLEEYKRILLN